MPLTFEMARFIKFIITEIFPGGGCRRSRMVEEHAEKAGFNVTRVQSLQPHYARTLDLWAAALRGQQGRGRSRSSPQEVYDRYMKYLTGCADLFRQGYTDVCQFTLAK